MYKCHQKFKNYEGTYYQRLIGDGIKEVLEIYDDKQQYTFTINNEDINKQISIDTDNGLIRIIDGKISNNKPVLDIVYTCERYQSVADLIISCVPGSSYLYVDMDCKKEIKRFEEQNELISLEKI